MDVTERRRAEEERQALAHANRITTMGQLTASIAHEVNQPIAAVVTNAQAALRWLNMQPPDPEEVRQALDRIVSNGRRAGDVIGRIRALVTKAPPRKDKLDINDMIREVIALTRSELHRTGTLLQTQLADGLPLVPGDRIELQQVMLNLILNAVEAMSGSDEGSRELLISTEARWRERRAHRRAGLGPGTEAGGPGPALRRILHDQARRHGHGTVDLPFDNRGTRRTRVGHDKCTPGSRPSVHPAAAGAEGVVSRRRREAVSALQPLPPLLLDLWFDLCLWP